jgi:hypothetical protein
MCECRIVPTCSRSDPHRVEYCQMHKAAPQMLEALRVLLADLSKPPAEQMPMACEYIEAVIERAEDRQHA